MFKAAFAGFVALLAAAPMASAQDYPTRAVRIVFPLAAGGGGDVFSRALADELQKATLAEPSVARMPIVLLPGTIRVSSRAR